MKNSFVKITTAFVCALCLFAVVFVNISVSAADKTVIFEEGTRYFGDIDNSGKVLANDARSALRHAVKLEIIAYEDLLYADINFDGIVNAADARIILRTAVNIETPFSYLPDGEEIKIVNVASKDDESDSSGTDEDNTADGEDNSQNNEQAPSDGNGSDNIVEITNEYDILRSGTFYCKGKMYNGEEYTSVDMAVTPDSVGLAMDMEESSINIFVKDSQIFMSSAEDKKYTQFDEEFLALVGASTEEFLGVGTFKLSSFPHLDDAIGIKPITVQGTQCLCYVFISSDGSATHVYIADDDTLKGFALYDSRGVLGTAYYIDFISSEIPSEMAFPDEANGYELIENQIEFLIIAMPEFFEAAEE